MLHLHRQNRQFDYYQFLFYVRKVKLQQSERV